MTKISKEEYEALKSLDDQWKWIARDLDGDHGGDLFIYPEKPFKNTYAEGWVYGMRFRYIDNRLFQFVQWDDSEPYSITELIEGYEKESEETELKSKQELIEKWELAIESAEFYGKGKEEELIGYMKEFVSDLKQLDEPEVTLDKAFEKVAESYLMTKEEIWRHLERLVSYGGKVTYGELDELEVLSQEWIDKHVETIFDLDEDFETEFIKVDDLQNLLVPKQELPVIPKFVADWIESRDYYNVYKVLQDLSAPGSPHASKDVRNWIFHNQENVEKFVRAWLDGYTVEKEQKYYALIKGHELLEGKADWIVPTYWCLDTTNGNMFISDRITVLDKYLIKSSKSEWNKLGINNSNADFVKVEELEK